MCCRSCGECVSTHGCGFCFLPNGSSLQAAQASCWSMDGDSHPLGGPCNSVDNVTPYTWASDWCPSQYYWVPIVAMCLYLIVFSPGNVFDPLTNNLGKIRFNRAEGYCGVSDESSSLKNSKRVWRDEGAAYCICLSRDFFLR